MLCKACGTEWWSETAGKECPHCNPMAKKFRDKIGGLLKVKRSERMKLNAEIELLDMLDIEFTP